MCFYVYQIMLSLFSVCLESHAVWRMAILISLERIRINSTEKPWLEYSLQSTSFVLQSTELSSLLASLLIINPKILMMEKTSLGLFSLHILCMILLYLTAAKMVSHVETHVYFFVK